MFAWIADRIAGRLRADSKHFSVDADLPPYDKQFHDIAEDDDSEHSGFTSKGSRMHHRWTWVTFSSPNSTHHMYTPNPSTKAAKQSQASVFNSGVEQYVMHCFR